ncbi:arsenite-transporting ATPase [Sedimentibacter acidaminivorans]|jgi:arsenite/tail-anchored protein-transporting ATPase|uniref:Arsenite-transporting ATPase n=1 Tax=Sedimentibacter acidaminivorans TaxID=913099 RepID=A0ABS4GEF9_9FIRM|nr:TRC40/GET3/ArsA family transport-energizing ATPase [Sedimentibacter acidaminivorans]MBP1926027.1 arsenite-transporting ATPase [Sedimentibacter acidaminivorans]
MNKIVFFGGKGGVGKTTCSASYAVFSAKSGLKTLLVSTDPAHSTSDIFEKKIKNEITNILPNLDAIEISGEKESKIYMDNVKISLKNVVSPVIVKEINKQIDAASISPGTEEAALFDKMIEIITEKNDEYDRIIFDTAPTGHTVRLLTLPELLGAWLDTLIKKRSKSVTLMSMANHHGQTDKKDIDNDEVIKILRKRYEKINKAKKIMMEDKLLSFIFVINAEKLPIDETVKAINILEKYNVLVDGIVVNKILPENMKDDFWKSKKEQEQKYLDIIMETFKGKKIFKLPLLQEDMKSNNIENIADKFSEFN